MKDRKFMKEMIKTTGDMWDKGWAERNAGNISVRLTREDVRDCGLSDSGGSWTALGKPLPDLAGEHFLVSGTGRFLRNVPLNLERNLGIIMLDDKGARYRTVWGFAGGGQPTSETPAHLQAHSVRKEITGGADRAVIHTHPTNLIALTYLDKFDTCGMTRLLWEMHAECVVVFPKGVEFLEWMMAGSQEIADATAEAFRKRDIVIWEHHGVFASGRNLDTAFGLIDTVEKASEIYIKVMSAGGVKNKLTLDEIVAIARNFGLEPAADILDILEGK